MSLVVVIPTIRPESYSKFISKWQPHFDKHDAKVITVWDGEVPVIEVQGDVVGPVSQLLPEYDQPLVFNYTDSVRNAGFLYAAHYIDDVDTFVTLDDDVYPIDGTDPLDELIKPLRSHTSISWMNTLLGDEPRVRGFPYAVRAEATVEVSHAAWIRTPDHDGPTQLSLLPKALVDPVGYGWPTFYRGPIPRGVLSPFCGMAIAFTNTVAPHVYYAPMGPSVKLHRFGDIWLGVNLKRTCDERNWAIYYGAATVDHSRASDVFKNLAAEAEGLRLNEEWWTKGDDVHPYFTLYRNRRECYRDRVASLLGVAA